MAADVLAHFFQTVSSEHEPELERAEAPAERDLPVAEVAVVVAGDEVGGGQGERGVEPGRVLLFYLFFYFSCLLL